MLYHWADLALFPNCIFRRLGPNLLPMVSTLLVISWTTLLTLLLLLLELITQRLVWLLSQSDSPGSLYATSASLALLWERDQNRTQPGSIQVSKTATSARSQVSDLHATQTYWVCWGILASSRCQPDPWMISIAFLSVGGKGSRKAGEKLKCFLLLYSSDSRAGGSRPWHIPTFAPIQTTQLTAIKYKPEFEHWEFGLVTLKLTRQLELFGCNKKPLFKQTAACGDVRMQLVSNVGSVQNDMTLKRKANFQYPSQSSLAEF